MSDPNSGGTPSPEQTPAPEYGQPAPPAYEQPQAYGQPPAYEQPQAYGQQPVYGQQPQQPYGAPAYPAYPSAPAYGGYAAPKTNTLAVVSLVSSLVGIFVLPFIGSIVGIITGHMSLGQIKRTGEQGRGIGLAGTIVGWVGIGFAIIGTIMLIAWIGWLSANMGTLRSM